MLLCRSTQLVRPSSRHLLLPLRSTFSPTTNHLRQSFYHKSAVKMSDAPYKIVTTPDAPSAIGPYSQAVVHNGLVFASGSIPFVPSTMTLVEGDIQAQTQQALDNMLAVVRASGSDKSHVLKTTVFIKDMNDFAKINEIYEKVFAPYKPARSAVEVARLPRDVGVEIECVAALK